VKYQNIKKYKLSHEKIAIALGYSSVKSFRCSTAHKRLMNGIDILLGTIKQE
jgi:hypothetical protein